MSTELTEAEREALFTRPRELNVRRDAEALEVIVERILTDRLATQQAGPGWFWTPDEWAEWSNELARLVPEDDVGRYSNPDGAQEGIIGDCLRAYVAERAALTDGAS